MNTNSKNAAARCRLCGFDQNNPDIALLRRLVQGAGRRPNAAAVNPLDTALMQMWDETRGLLDAALYSFERDNLPTVFALMRLILERTTYAHNAQRKPDDFRQWQLESLAHQQEILCKMMEYLPEHSRQFREELRCVRKDAKSLGEPQLKGHAKYSHKLNEDIPDMGKSDRLGYELSSLFVHPTYDMPMGKLNLEDFNDMAETLHHEVHLLRSEQI